MPAPTSSASSPPQPFPSDIEISRSTHLKPISTVGQQLGIDPEVLIPYGHYKAKVPHQLIDRERIRSSHLVLVTAMTPTPLGIGKTTTSVSLSLGLNKIGQKAVLALREPSQGPCFGMKGGAAGGGYAQVLPMEEINLHFTGDFHAVSAANNTLAALLDNHQYQAHRSGDQPLLKHILWKRVLDVNDRALRKIVTGLGDNSNGLPAETGFDITPASEIMAILCLAADLEDLRQRIDRILVGYTLDGEPFTVKDLGVGGALTVLLKEAIHPNLVQTTENTPALIHGGPFANIAHGCNSVLATQLAMTFGDYAITEAGFGADLGAEKFLNIKCRQADIAPNAAVVVVTSQALKLHGGVPLEATAAADLEGLKAGLANLDQHLRNLQGFGLPVIVSFNQFGFDREDEIDYLRQHVLGRGVAFAVNRGFTRGGDGAIELAETVVETIKNNPLAALQFTYGNEDELAIKVEKVATQIYGARGVRFETKAEAMLTRIQACGYGHLPVCIAKTQYSFSDDPSKIGVAKDFEITIQDLIINSGAGFIVAVAGNMMRMPGLPKEPRAKAIDLVNGEIEGLS
jgi:formate--tetrahydrofolate ligase